MSGQEVNEGWGPGVVRVLAAVVMRDGRWLLCRRPEHKRHGGCWEFPGGKLEAGEDLAHAAQRELREELGVEVTATGVVLFRRQDPGSPYLIEFVEVSITGEPAALEHAELRWVTPGESAGLPLAPADRDFADAFRSGGLDDGRSAGQRRRGVGS